MIRTAIVSLVAAALAVGLGTTAGPANGHDLDAAAADSHAPNAVDTARFDGWLYADPETGCVEPRPRTPVLPDVVPAEPGPARDVEDDIGERLYERDEHQRVPLDAPGPNVHAEPWPTCDASRSATTVGTNARTTDD